MSKKGIDVSEHNGKLDWSKIKCDFALIRGGYGSDDTDGEFRRNAENCTVPFGVYWFSYAYTVDRAVTEAEKVIAVLKTIKKKPILPIFFDWEYDSDRYAKQNGVTVDKALFSKMAKAFMDKIIAAGYKAGNYYNNDYFKTYCDASILDRKKYCQWYAYYGDSTTQDCDIWQYTESGVIAGFGGDINELKNEALLKSTGKPVPEKPVPVKKNSRVLATGKNQITNSFGDGHGGIDVVKATNELDSIIAHTAGTVVFCQTGIPNDQGSGGNRSYGNCIKLQHNGGYCTLYAHMDSVCVESDEAVEEGQKIGYMGNTGNSYGAHLHFEVRDTDDDRIDPEPYLNASLPGESAPEPTPEPTPKAGKYKIGDKVIINGTLYTSSDSGANGKVENTKTIITRYSSGAKYPYNTTGDLGWMAEASIKLQREKPKPAKYSKGSYKITADVLTVRTKPTSESDWIPYAKLTANAQKQIQELANYEANGYVKGMICDVNKVSDIWGQTPSGWICLDYCSKV